MYCYRFVLLIMDEMKIHEDLVYDKTGENLHGFIDLGNVYNQLQELERQVNDISAPHTNIATHMLTLMVRGIFIKLEFPYASFPTQGKSACICMCIAYYQILIILALILCS